MNILGYAYPELVDIIAEHEQLAPIKNTPEYNTLITKAKLRVAEERLSNLNIEIGKLKAKVARMVA